MIRLRYTGLLVFGTEVLSFFTGFIYLSYIARSLSVIDYGVWSLILGMLVYFSLLQDTLSFWSLRDCSRGLPVEKTAVLGNLLISIPFLAAFLVLAPSLAHIANSSPSLFYLSCIIIPATYLMRGIQAVIRAKKPHQIAYQNIIMDGLKILSILYLVQFGLVGVILSYSFGLYSYLLYALSSIRAYLAGRFDSSRLKRWLFSSWVTLYGQIGGKIFTGIDILLLGLLGSRNIGSYSVAETISSTITSARGLSYALYPKLLKTESRNKGDIEKTMSLLLMFLVPMTVGCILLSPNLIEMFGSKYLSGLVPLQILVASECINVAGAVDRFIALGGERIDEKEVTVRGMLKSKIFLIESVAYIGTFVAIPITVLLVPQYDITGAAMAILASQTVTSLIEMLSTRFAGLRALPKEKILKFIIASCVMSLVIVFFYSKGTLKTLILIAASIAVYFSTLTLIDRDTRFLGKAVINEIRGTIKRVRWSSSTT